MNTAPLTVIIPTYRDGDALRRALRSVACQTLQPREVIVVDDASGDESTDRICSEYVTQPIKLIKLPRNRGPGAARNTGILASSEPFLAFLDADDEWHPEKLRIQMELMLAPGAPLLSSHRKGFAGTAWSSLNGPINARCITRRAILIANVAPISTVVMRRDAVRHHFPQTYACEDYWFVAAHVLSGIRSVRMDETLARADKPAFGTTGLSGRLHAMQLGEMRTHLSLWRTGLISAREYAPLVAWTLAKYLRRLSIVQLRNVAVHLTDRECNRMNTTPNRGLER
ncbi:glycosyltransferase family 2 protein [Bradyrhizobium elkanii]|uniref:Glycosyltransferase involved in cell wall biosynthesis n=1 Tax=Bradyrhizobium elkanii TaxID=29448 RepID=A0A8I1Y0F7_BRAEL|nr:glycosyltransferase family 2 protein [Bradyrhizobium elkanii]MBP1290292.1 glycosyltransferase involved in cell wall biosynthesis [Bradyrhizobium elkanii]MCP1975612.1 glycosyltransferase involved in cell wall biosynthesis [Bradyrhizobium elkanii]MCS3482377.1 glycosyltransferase involved in cell wall biosynthesis [Bradyrhizobium elkanii]MCS3525245.1 glycosyltransferase involved in cell wall biosynthesis [Bradyrhizobium elkanii]MCS4075852.1 glycosyltransferase involved in cell wall biosynthesi